MNIEVLGPRGVGKTTVGKTLSEHLGVRYVSLGRIARGEMEGQTELGIQMQDYINNKIPYPEGFLSHIMFREISLAHEDGGFVLDGYPRRKSEAEELRSILNRLNMKLDFIIKLEAPLDELKERLQNRLVCQKCDANSRRSEDNTGLCAYCNGNLISRSDDNPEDIRRAFNLYQTEKEGIIDVLSTVTQHEILTLDGTPASSFVISGLIHMLNKIPHQEIDL